MRDLMKFLPSLKHLFLFFLSFSKDKESKWAGEVESGKVVKNWTLGLLCMWTRFY
jgi:hypothetical protein